MRLWFWCFAACAIAAHASAADNPRSFFAGKQITITVGEPPGGGADAYARLVQRHLPRHIPGQPAIVVQNMPGAGSLKSVTWLTGTAPADGTAMTIFNSELLDESLTARDRVNVDFRSFNWVGNISEDLRVCFVSAKVGVANWQSLRARSRPLFWSGTAAGTAGNADQALLQQLLGLPVTPVQGYAGAADKRLALERGEVDGDSGGWTAIPPNLLRDGKINIVVRLSPTAVAGIDPRIPFAGDLISSSRDRTLYDFLVAPERLGRLLVMSGKAPKTRVEAIRVAFNEMVDDPAFRAEAARLHLLVTPMRGEEVARQISALYSTPPDVIAAAKRLLHE